MVNFSRDSTTNAPTKSFVGGMDVFNGTGRQLDAALFTGIGNVYAAAAGRRSANSMTAAPTARPSSSTPG